MPPVFCPPRLIATPDGDCPVEYLRAGDRVMTRDNGAQIIRWIGACGLTGADLRAAPHLHPILIPAGALAVGVPARDLLVSPNHRVLASSDKTALYFAQCEALVAAKHLVGLNGVRVADVPWMTYFHILFDRHQVVMSNGVWSESFQPEDQSLRGTDNSQRLEIFDLFPELEARQKRARSPGVGPQARPCREALLVTP